MAETTSTTPENHDLAPVLTTLGAPARKGRLDLDLWIRRSSALLVAVVAAYGSYQHQRMFALHAGADPTSAKLWPLSVDGLLVLATAGLLQVRGRAGHRTAVMIWVAFSVGILVSLAANIAAAPTLGWRPVLVAGWPPVALLLAVELLAHRSARHRDVDETRSETQTETRTETALGLIDGRSRPATAKQIMAEHYRRERSNGRTPTGAELDKVAGTNNYGRAVLRELREWEHVGHPTANGAPEL